MRKSALLILIAAALLLMGSGLAAHAHAETWLVRASWYGPGFAGKTMANGDRFNPRDPTIVAAPPHFAELGARLKLTNLKTGKTIEVTVQDRGPYCCHRELDLSRAAAREMGMLGSGVTILEVNFLRHEGDINK